MGPARYGADVGGFFRPHRDKTTLAIPRRLFTITPNLNTQGHQDDKLRFLGNVQTSYRPATSETLIFSCKLLQEATDVTREQR